MKNSGIRIFQKLMQKLSLLAYLIQVAPVHAVLKVDEGQLENVEPSPEVPANPPKPAPTPAPAAQTPSENGQAKFEVESYRNSQYGCISYSSYKDFKLLDNARLDATSAYDMLNTMHRHGTTAIEGGGKDVPNLADQGAKATAKANYCTQLVKDYIHAYRSSCKQDLTPSAIKDLEYVYTQCDGYATNIANTILPENQKAILAATANVNKTAKPMDGKVDASGKPPGGTAGGGGSDAPAAVPPAQPPIASTPPAAAAKQGMLSKAGGFLKDNAGMLAVGAAVGVGAALLMGSDDDKDKDKDKTRKPASSGGSGGGGTSGGDTTTGNAKIDAPTDKTTQTGQTTTAPTEQSNPASAAATATANDPAYTGKGSAQGSTGDDRDQGAGDFQTSFGCSAGLSDAECRAKYACKANEALSECQARWDSGLVAVE